MMHGENVMNSSSKWAKTLLLVIGLFLISLSLYNNNQVSKLNEQVSNLTSQVTDISDELIKLVLLSTESLPTAAGFPSTGNAFYIDPVNGSSSGDGSFENPWKSLQEVINSKFIETQSWTDLPYKSGAELVTQNSGAPIKGGDTIYLMDGQYGSVRIMSHYNSEPITLKAYDGHTPIFTSMTLLSVSNWKLQGLYFNPEVSLTAGEPRPKTLLSVVGHGYRGPSSDVTIENSTFKSAEEIDSWSDEDWRNLASSGIETSGPRMIARNNTLMNIRFGITMKGSHARVENNEIINFSGDGMRGLGDYSIFEYNLVKNSYDVDSNHDDGFQSWSIGEDGRVGKGVVKGITLRGNTIINFEDENQPLRGPLQGIGCFDGMFEGWTVENNVVLVDHWHGISFLGAKNMIITNNTVVDINHERPGPPWIKVEGHKNGTPGSDNLVRNNIAHRLITNNVLRTTADHNIFELGLDRSMFVDWENHDLRLVSNSVAIDAGAELYAPLKDINNIPRNIGQNVDIGAHEFFER